MAWWDSFTGKSAERKGRAIAQDMRAEAKEYGGYSRGAIGEGINQARRDLWGRQGEAERYLAQGQQQASQQLQAGTQQALQAGRGLYGQAQGTVSRAFGDARTSGRGLYASARGGFDPFTKAGAAGIAGLQDERNLEGLYDAARQRVMRQASASGLSRSTKVPEYLMDEYAQIASREADRRQAINSQLAGMGFSAQGQIGSLYGQQAGLESSLYGQQAGLQAGMYGQQAGMEADIYGRHAGQQADLLSSLYGDLGRGRLAYGQNMANLAYGGGQQMAGLYESEADRILGTRAGESQLVQARAAGNQALLGAGFGAIGTAVGGGFGARRPTGAGGDLGYYSPYSSGQRYA